MRNTFITIILLITLSLSNVFSQSSSITISGMLKDKTTKTPLSYVNVILKTEPDSSFVTGTVSDDEGRFTLSNIKPDNYLLEFSFIGYNTKTQKLYVGELSDFLDVSTIELEEDLKTLNEVLVTAKQDDVSSKMDKKVFSVGDNISQNGGSVLQAMQNLPGVTV